MRPGLAASRRCLDKARQHDDQQRQIEARNGSGQTTRQYVWGTQYIDEIVHEDINGEPSVDNDCLAAVESAAEDNADSNTDANGRSRNGPTFGPTGTHHSLAGAKAEGNECWRRRTRGEVALLRAGAAATVLTTEALRHGEFRIES